MESLKSPGLYFIGEVLDVGLGVGLRGGAVRMRSAAKRRRAIRR
jgi:predicted flavoprotein YhiN